MMSCAPPAGLRHTTSMSFQCPIAQVDQYPSMQKCSGWIHRLGKIRFAVHRYDLVCECACSGGNTCALSLCGNQTGQHHEAHHLFFVAGSEAGRDEWVDLLVERGMFRAKYTEEHAHSMGHHHHCMGCERTHTADIAPTCEDSHPLQRKVLSSAQSCDCNYCGALIGAKDVVFRCHVCDFDLCFDCHKVPP
ncbi:MAG: hypothetical protein ACPIOQ_12630 [Promethearchaeia archaeon]